LTNISTTCPAHIREGFMLIFEFREKPIRRTENSRKHLTKSQKSHSTNLISCGKYNIVLLKIYFPYNYDAELACTVCLKKLSFANIFGKTEKIKTETETREAFSIRIRECFAAEDVEQMSNLHLHEMKEFLIRCATSY
jgi:hypothetical protein